MIMIFFVIQIIFWKNMENESIILMILILNLTFEKNHVKDKDHIQIEIGLQTC